MLCSPTLGVILILTWLQFWLDPIPRVFYQHVSDDHPTSNPLAGDVRPSREETLLPTKAKRSKKRLSTQPSAWRGMRLDTWCTWPTVVLGVNYSWAPGVLGLVPGIVW